MATLPPQYDLPAAEETYLRSDVLVVSMHYARILMVVEQRV